MDGFGISFNGWRYRLNAPDGRVWRSSGNRWRAVSRRGQGSPRAITDDLVTFWELCDAEWDEEFRERFGVEPPPSVPAVPSAMRRGRGRQPGTKVEAAEFRREEAIYLRDKGLDASTIAARLKVDLSTVWRYFREHAAGSFE